MKTLKIIFLIQLFVLASLTSCKKPDNTIYDVLNNTDMNGVVLRTLNMSELPSLVTLTNAANNFVDLNIEVQENQGDFVPDFKEVRVYVSFYQEQEQENFVEDGDGNPTSEVLLMSVPSSDFTIGAHGLPVHNFHLTTQDMVDLLPDSTVFPTPAFMKVRLEIEMTDGRIYTDDTGNGMVASSQYFASPFAYVFVYINA